MKLIGEMLFLAMFAVACGGTERVDSAVSTQATQGRALPAEAAAKKSQVEPNHMRWSNHDAVLSNSIAWQEERAGRWVTVVLLTDRPIDEASVNSGAAPASLMTEAKAQGIGFPVMSGGVPPPAMSFDVAYRDGEEVSASSVNGAGGFEIKSLSATRIKGRTVMNAMTTGSRDEHAWSVEFDAAVVGGNAEKMAAEGESLVDGGQPWIDFLAAQKAMREMDYGTISRYASPDMVAFLEDPAKRAKNLEMLKGMTPPSARLLGGLRRGSEATLYWVKENPAGLDSRCVETLSLIETRWRATASACQAE